MANADRPNAPGVVVLHSWFGLTDHFRRVCDDLASVGFTAAAPDLYDGAVTDDPAHAKTLRQALDDDTALARAAPAVETLREECGADAAIAVVGFSMGGEFALEMTSRRPGEFAAVVTFYGARVCERGVTTPVQGHFADQDPFVTPSELDDFASALADSGTPHELHHYPGTGHAFTNAARAESFHAPSAELAWRRTCRFLGALLG